MSRRTNYIVQGGLIALVTGGEHYGDLPIWGGAALILAALSFIRRKEVG